MSSAGLPGIHRKSRAGLPFSPFLWFWEDGGQFWAAIFTVAQPLDQVLCELPGIVWLNLWPCSLISPSFSGLTEQVWSKFVVPLSHPVFGWALLKLKDYLLSYSYLSDTQSFPPCLGKVSSYAGAHPASLWLGAKMQALGGCCLYNPEGCGRLQ